MTGDRKDRPTVMRNLSGGEGRSSGGGGRDDRTRVRMPSLDRGVGGGQGARSDATRHVDRGGPRSSDRAGGGGTVRMQAIPRRFGWLIVKTGPRIGHVHPLGDVTDLGRGPDNDIIIDDERVSEQHARVRVDDEGQFVIWDLASTNGTFVNGERITAATPLVENDEVRVGHVVLVLKTLDVS